MKFLELLAKLGILRYGTKSATYTSGRDLPAEFMMDGGTTPSGIWSRKKT